MKNSNIIYLEKNIYDSSFRLNEEKVIENPKLSHDGIKKHMFDKITERENYKKPTIPKQLFKKFINLGETFLRKFPLKKIVPIMKRTQNRNFMWITFFIIKFVKILKEKTFSEKFNRLNDNHFALINDNSKLPGDSYKFFKRKTINSENFLLRKVKNAL